MYFFLMYNLNLFIIKPDREDLNDGDSGEIFNVLRNIRSHLDKVLEMNQTDIDSMQIDEDVEDKKYDKIESHLIGCVSVICDSIKSNNDNKVKNVIIFSILIFNYHLQIANKL